MEDFIMSNFIALDVMCFGAVLFMFGFVRTQIRKYKARFFRQVTGMVNDDFRDRTGKRWITIDYVVEGEHFQYSTRQPSAKSRGYYIGDEYEMMYDPSAPADSCMLAEKGDPIVMYVGLITVVACIGWIIIGG
ncbi:MAG: hypothetical protein LBN08_01620 [Lactobacillales bacterium]|jgi:hypothetical protein|nr:hypothetical protein [Lactobacillales bacterium]